MATSNKPSDQDNFYEWMQAVDAEETRRLYATCQCGCDATYGKDKKVDTTYFHSYWCPKYKEKPKNTDGK